MNPFRLIRKPFNYTYNNVTLYIIFINIVIYFLTKYFFQHGIILKAFFALIPQFFIDKKMFWQAFSYMFLHDNFWHIFFNMLTLFWFGTAVEQKMGSKEFLLFYLLTGTLAGIAMGLVYYYLNIYTLVVGASGALYAVMLAFAVLYPDSNIYLYFMLPIPSAVLIIAYFFIELFSMFSNDGVAHIGHLFGLIFGWLYIKIRYKISILKVFGFK